MKKESNQKNKKILIFIIVGIVLLFIIILLLLLLGNKKEIKPYVIEKEIEVLPADGEYNTSVEPYFKDDNKNVIDIEGITWKISTSTYKFYDYSVSEPNDDNYVTHTFKIEATIPIEYVEETNRTYPNHKYTTLFSQPSLFDYYTGTVFKEKHVSKNNTINYYDISTTEEDMAFTEVTWKDKTYRIGVTVESSMKWDGINKTDNGNGTRTVNDVSTIYVDYIIYAPKEYDGLMAFFNKAGTTKQDFLNQLEYNNKYNELVKEANETGQKSDELKEMEESINNTFKLLDARKKGDKEFKNDDFYVIKVSEIKAKQ